MAQFQYVDHSSTTDLEAVIDAAPADLRTVAVRGHLGGVAYEDRGVWGSWAVGWHDSATPSRLDAMTQSSSLNLSLTYPGGRKINFSEDADLTCPRVGGLYVDTATDTAWITDPCSLWVHAFDIGSDGTLTHNLDTSLTMSELYPPEGVGRRDATYSPYTLWSDGEILWVAERDIGMMLPYRLSDGKFLRDQRFIMGPFKPRWGHSFLAPAALWSDGKTLWVADAMISQLIFAVKLENELWVGPSQDLFVPSAFDNCYIPEMPRPSDMMPSATCTNETALGDALDDKNNDSPVGAYSDGRWFWIAVDYSDNNKAGRLLAFNLLSGERAASRDIALHHDIKNPIGMWSDGENLWVIDQSTKRLYTFAVPAQTSQQEPSAGTARATTGAAGTGAGAAVSQQPSHRRARHLKGTAQVKQMLTADVSGIADADGLDDVSYTYQWPEADNVNISGATGASYQLTDSEKGKAVKVRVSFTDDAGNQESLTSEATGAVAAKPFGLDDFDAGDGQTVLANALIQAGDQGRKNRRAQDRAWYATDTSIWRASGELRDGSLTWNGMTLNRVAYFSATGALRFNEADDVHIGNSFAAGGVNREVTVWIQTEKEAVSFLAKDHIMNSGSGWINFEVPTGIRSVLGGVSKDDLVIIAVSAPADP